MKARALLMTSADEFSGLSIRLYSIISMLLAIILVSMIVIVRKQAEFLLEAEKVLKGQKVGKNSGADAEGMRAEIRKLDGAKMSGYEDYKEGKMIQEAFLERKKVLDIRRQELSVAVSELETQEIVEGRGSTGRLSGFRSTFIWKPMISR